MEKNATKLPDLEAKIPEIALFTEIWLIPLVGNYDCQCVCITKLFLNENYYFKMIFPKII